MKNLKYILLFEKFSNAIDINENAKENLKTPTKFLRLKPRFLSKIKKILGVSNDKELAKEDIKQFQKKRGIKEAGNLDHRTILSVLKGEEPDNTNKLPKETPTIPGEKSPTKNAKANENFISEENETDYLAKYTSQKKQVIGFLNSIFPSTLPFINDKVDSAIPSKFEKCYTVNYLVSSKEVCFSAGLSVEIKSIKIKDATFTAPTEFKTDGYVKGKLKGTVDLKFFAHIIGERGIGDDLSIDFEQNVWLYKFSQIQIYPPLLNISTKIYDLGVVWAWVSNNNFKIENSLIGTYKWDLPIQKNVNTCFDPKGGPYIKNVSSSDLSKWISI